MNSVHPTFTPILNSICPPMDHDAYARSAGLVRGGVRDGVPYWVHPDTGGTVTPRMLEMWQHTFGRLDKDQASDERPHDLVGHSKVT